MIIVDMVEVDREASKRLGNALVPSRVVNGARYVVHACWIWFCFRLLSKYRGVKEDVSDITQFVVLDVDLVLNPKNCNEHWLRDLVSRIVDSTNAGNDPDKILMRKILAHELCHDAQPADLDLDIPVLDVVLHSSN